MRAMLVYLMHLFAAGARGEVVENHVNHRVPELVVAVTGVDYKSRGYQGLPQQRGRQVERKGGKVYV